MESPAYATQSNETNDKHRVTPYTNRCFTVVLQGAFAEELTSTRVSVTKSLFYKDSTLPFRLVEDYLMIEYRKVALSGQKFRLSNNRGTVISSALPTLRLE